MPRYGFDVKKKSLMKDKNMQGMEGTHPKGTSPSKFTIVA